MGNIRDLLGDVEWFDATALSSFRACPMKYWYRHERGLVPVGGFQPDLAFGIAIHLGLECIYNGTWADWVEIDEGQAAYIKLHLDSALLHEGRKMRKFFWAFLTNFPKEQEFKDKTQLNGLRLLAAYVKKWHAEPFKVIATEQTFHMGFDAPSGPFYLVGRIDLIGEWGDGIKPMDHKTTSRYSEIWEGSFKLDLAPSGYINFVRKMYDPKCYELCINGLRVTKNIDKDSFQRKWTQRHPHELQRWEHEIITTVEDIRRCRQTGFWSQHANNCYAYMRECEYRGPCLYSDEGREGALAASYEHKPWEPI